MIADVAGVQTEGALTGDAVDPVGDDDAAGVGTGYNRAGYLTTNTIDQAGEYFSFDVRVESIMGFGVVDIDEETAGYTEADFCSGSGNGHTGYKWSLWFHPTPNGPWTLYGRNPGYVMGPGWSSAAQRFSTSEEGADWLAGDPVKLRVGIDANSFIHCDYYDASEAAWVMMARSSYPVPEGVQYKLGIKFGDSIGRLASLPKIHEVEEDDSVTVGTSATTLAGDAAGDITGAGVTVATAAGLDDGFITTDDKISTTGEYFQITGLSENDSHAIGLVYSGDLDAAQWLTLMNDGPTHIKDGYFLGTNIDGYERSANLYATLTGAGYSSTAGPGRNVTGRYHWRLGIDHDGRAFISASADGILFDIVWRTDTAVPAGDYRFAWKTTSNGGSFASGGLTMGQLSQAPAMAFRYVESPDGVFNYPVFATAEEAAWYDEHHDGVTGSGASLVVVFPDDPTFTQWHIPATGYTNNGTAAPAGGTFQGNAITWTEVTTLTNADLAPAAYTDTTITVNEFASVNIQLQPQDVGYTTTVSGAPAGLMLFAGALLGTAPEVTGYIGTNDSDDYTITVTRTNSYGSSSGTLTLRVMNLTQQPTAPTGTTLATDPATLVGDDLQTLGAISLDDTVEAGRRLVIPRAWVEANVLPLLGNDPAKRVYMGVAASGADYDAADLADWDAHIMWRGHASGHEAYLYDGTSTSYWLVSSATQAFYDYAIEMDNSGNLAMIACNVNSINTEPAVSAGGSFSNSASRTYTAPATVTMFLSGVTMDISGILTDLSEIDIPAAPSTLTDWGRALDFSGGSERAEMVSSNTSNQPLAQSVSGQITIGTDGYTSNAFGAKPWATAVVFKIDGNSSNQHIWNQGEGAGSTDDNIYLRVDAAQNLYFGWGRDGALNECRIATAISSGHWYGVYIAHDGRKYGGAGATPGNLHKFFDIRLMSSHNGDWSTSTDVGTYNDWNQASSTTGGRMDRQIMGSFSVGGRGANRNFHGKVASMVVTTLRVNAPMPTIAEAEMMITDPMQWLQDYKVGQFYRRPYTGTDYGNWQIGNTSGVHYPSNATQVYLMGDGPNDSYSNMIRNQANTADQNYTKLNLINMVSNDIENVNIPGLS